MHVAFEDASHGVGKEEGVCAVVSFEDELEDACCRDGGEVREGGKEPVGEPSSGDEWDLS